MRGFRFRQPLWIWILLLLIPVWFQSHWFLDFALTLCFLCVLQEENQDDI